VVRRCVRFRNLKNEEAMPRVGSQCHRKKNPAVFISKLVDNNFFLFFYSRTVHLDIIRVFYLPTDAQESY